jgi:ADP-ribosylglycohydrolase
MNGKPEDHERRIARARLSLLGLSVGDAFGERFFGPRDEALARIGARELPPPPWAWTDDTEMAVSVVDVLESCGGIDQDALAAAFARRYDPRRGYGSGAHRILAALRAGTPWQAAAAAAFEGAGSFGNGAAMRAAPIGAYFAGDPARAADETRRSAAVTHHHPEGQAGAVAVAVAAALAARNPGAPLPNARELLHEVARHTPPGATRDGIDAAANLEPSASPVDAGEQLGAGSCVTAPDTVPYALWCAAWFLDSWVDALWNTVSALGDRDTTCAIVGGIVVLAHGPAAIPPEWLAAREPLPA